MKFIFLALTLVLSNMVCSSRVYADDSGHLSFFNGQVTATLTFDAGITPTLSDIPLMDIELRANGKTYDTKSMSAVMYLTRAPSTTVQSVYVAQQEGLCIPPIHGSYYASFPNVKIIGNWTLALTLIGPDRTPDTQYYTFDVK